MSFTDIFIRRPVVATVLSLILLLAGLQAYFSLNVRQFPRSDIAVISVKTRAGRWSLDHLPLRYRR